MRMVARCGDGGLHLSPRSAGPLTRTMIRRLQREQFILGDPVRIWDFFATPRNLAAITPAHLGFEVIGELPPQMYAGQMIEYRIGLLPGVSTRWLTEITHLRVGELFVDEQRIGPYRLWHHEHHFAPTSDGRGVTMVDRITYDPGWGLLGGVVDTLWIKAQLRGIFDYRAKKIAARFGG